jgi:hypothetical protein
MPAPFHLLLLPTSAARLLRHAGLIGSGMMDCKARALAPAGRAVRCLSATARANRSLSLLCLATCWIDRAAYIYTLHMSFRVYLVIQSPILSHSF